MAKKPCRVSHKRSWLETDINNKDKGYDMVDYATVADVKRILQAAFSFGAGTIPTGDDVEDFIEAAEDEIDDRTQNAWRTVSVSDEFYDIIPPGVTDPSNNYFYNDPGIAIYLRHRIIKDFSNGSGDKIEVWDGNGYFDWVTEKTEGRDGDWWLDNEQGILYLKQRLFYYLKKGLRLTYRYGATAVPKDIRDATAMIAATNLIMSDDRSAFINETGDPTRMNFGSRIDKMQLKIDGIIYRRTEIILI